MESKSFKHKYYKIGKKLKKKLKNLNGQPKVQLRG